MWKDLFSLSWWRQTLNSLTTVDIHQRWSQVVGAFNNPRSNPVLFLMVLAVIIVAVLIVVLTIVMIVSAVSARRERFALVDEKGKATSVLPTKDAKAQAVQSYRANWRRYSLVLTIIVGVFLVFIGVGVSTSTSLYCKACHGRDKKIAVMQSGDHQHLSCVQCHEGGGTVARFTVNSFQRVGHLMTGLSRSSQPTGYSTVPASACLNCHAAAVASTTTVSSLGNNSITMAHQQPTDAGMTCSRCHNLTTAKTPVVQRGTMSTCLICHDGKQAPNACTTCHVSSPQRAITVSKPSAANADRLLSSNPNASCYNCHTDASTCDACHGLRLPHPDGFEDNHGSTVLRYGVSTCKKCHTTTPDPTGKLNTTSSVGGAQPCSNCHVYNINDGQWDYQTYLSTGGRQ